MKFCLPYTPATPTHSRYTTTRTHPPLLRYLKHPLLIKNFLEKKFSHMTGAQSYMLLYDLKESMLENSGTISLLEFPSDASIAARKRKPFSARMWPHCAAHVCALLWCVLTLCLLTMTDAS